jgi:hypothetical protein
MRSTKLSPTQVAYRYSEYGLAYHFAELHQGNLAFIPELTCRMAHRWYIRDEKTGEWKPDKMLRVPWWISNFCSDNLDTIDPDDPPDPETRLRICSRSTHIAVELLARCNPRLVRTPEQVGIKPKEKVSRRKP